MNFIDKTYSAAIFDMDGTMFDTERLRMDMLKKASGEIFGQEISDALLFDCLGVSAVTGERLAKELYGKDYPYKKIRARADEMEREYVRNCGVPVKDGLYNLLERLKKNNVFIALATSSRREIAEEYLINAKVFRYFDILVCGDDVKKGKPDPEIFLRAASELMCPPAQCLIFEDSQNGLKAAGASGGIPIFIKDIKEPEADVKAVAYKSYNSMRDFLDDFIAYTPKLPMPMLTEPFPLNEENIIVGIHGFGAVGGGYLAPIFSHWDGYTRPKQIIGTTRDPLLISLVNSLGKYRIRYESQAYFQNISNIRLIDANDQSAVIDMYASACIIGLALPENVIRLQAKLIALGLIGRYDNGGGNLTILVAMNKVYAGQFVKNHVSAALKTLKTPDEANAIIARTKFIGTVVNRMVLPVSDGFIISKFENDLYQLHHNTLDISGTINEVTNFFDYYFMKAGSGHSGKKASKSSHVAAPPISISESLSALARLSEAMSEVTLTLFVSEPDMPLYAAPGSDIVGQLRQVVVTGDIGDMQKIKNKLSNGTHAIIAWYSMLLGYKTIGQGMGDHRVEALARRIMKYEIKPALLVENPDSGKHINAFIHSFIKRCRYSFTDKCARVGRDVLRKLQNGERIIGAIQMAENQGLATDGLEFGAACAILCCVTNPADEEAKKVKALFDANHAVADVLTYDGEYNKGRYKGLDRVQDKALIERIQNQLDTLEEELNDIS